MTTPYLALFTADWQLCNSLPHSRSLDNGETDRLQDQCNVIEQIGAIAKEYHVDGIYVLGDVFERRLLDAITLRTGLEAVLLLTSIAPIYLLPGNHDVNTPRGGRNLLEAFEVIEHEKIYYLDNRQQGDDGFVFTSPYDPPVRFFAIPWGPLSEVKELIDFCRSQVSKKEVSVLLLHQGINGCTDGGWACDNELDPDETCEGFDLVLAGHFHDRQKFGSCGEYVGAPMQHDFRDAGSGRRGVVLVEFSEHLTKKFIEIDSPQFHVRKVTRDSRVLTDPVPVKGDYLRIDVEATQQEWRTWLPDIEKYANELREIGVNVLPPKHVPIAQIETRLGKSTPSFLEAASGYVKLANTEGLNPKRLMEIASETLNEVENG